jgi:hypothetical protein
MYPTMFVALLLMETSISSLTVDVTHRIYHVNAATFAVLQTNVKVINKTLIYFYGAERVDMKIHIFC